MKILVTGGAGFIGSHVTDAFLADGHEVAVMDNLATGSRENVATPAQFYEADLRDGAALEKVLRDFAPDVVNHHAAQISVPDSVHAPAFDADINITGALRLWQAARDCGAARFIFASSGGAIYGANRNLPLKESEPAAPLSPYGLSKQVFELYLNQLRAYGGPFPVILRYANVYGPRQGARGEAGVVSVFLKRLMNGETCTIYGDGGATRDYVFVSDVAQANRLALVTDQSGPFNIASGTQTSTLELFQLCRDITARGTAATHLQEPLFAPERPGDVRDSCLNNTRAARELHWHPKVALRPGLESVVESLRLAAR